MNVLGTKIELSDLIPPIFNRIWQKVSHPRIHPFDCIPSDLQVEWIMDVGANIGEITLAGLRSFTDCKAICFEPVKNTFMELEHKLKPYSSRVFLNNFALGNVNDELEINITSFHGANSIHPQSEAHKILNPHVREVGVEKIKVVRLDDIVLQLPHAHIDVLKIDVEGYEKQVILGGENFIKNNVDTIIIEISIMRDQKTSSQCVYEIFELLNSFGFKLTNCFDQCLSPKNELVQMDCCFRHERNYKLTGRK